MKKSNNLSEKYQEVSTPTHVQKVKVVTVGDISVGKSSLALRFTKGYFEDLYKPTVGGKKSCSDIEYCFLTILSFFSSLLMVSFTGLRPCWSTTLTRLAEQIDPDAIFKYGTYSI